MLPTKEFSIRSSTRIHTITTLLLILFCFFKTERYSFSTPSVPAPARAVQEQIEPDLPAYSFPRLTQARATDVPVQSEFQPPGFGLFGHLFALLQREYARYVHVQLHLCNFIPPGTTWYSCSYFRHRLPSNTADDDNLLSII